MALQEELEVQGNWMFRHRSLLPLIVLLVGTGAQWLAIHTSGVLFTIVFPHWKMYEYLCLMISLAGVFVRVYTVGHTPAGTSGRNTVGQVADCLNTTGIYSVVRHPLYLGNFLIWLGIALLTCNINFITVFVLVYWIYYERIMYAEEQFLRRKFRNLYMDWSAQTPAFIPRIGHFKPSALPFSWKKVVKKEKNGVFALFLLFSLFDSMAVWQTENFSVNRVLLAMALLSGMAYVILKYIKKHTRLLDEEGR